MKIKNKILTAIEIERMAAEGKCVAHHDGKVVFVNQVAPGDVVDIQIIKKRRNYLEGNPVHFHTYSPLRTQPFCDHFGTCGGCKWQHIGYETQLAFKQQQVIDAMERIAKVPVHTIHPILGSKETRFYRNKLEYTFSNKRWLTREEIESGSDLGREALGFHIPGRFDKILDIEKCYLQLKINSHSLI
jgi:23S rRNA (uracil1939-C5)-methyltransferase